MNKIPCDVIRDLLPLYIDDICSEKSHSLVEEHLEECDDCRSCYEDMKNDLPKVLSPEEMDSIDELREFLRAAGKRTEELAIELAKRLTFKRIIIIGVIMLIAFTAHYLNTNTDTIPEEFISVKETYELENGNLYMVLESKLPIVDAYMYIGDSRHNPGKFPDGNIRLSIQCETQLWRFWDNSLPKEQVIIIDKANPVNFMDVCDYYDYSVSPSTPQYYRSLYYKAGTRSELLWKYDPNQEYEPAPAEIEASVQDYIDSSRENPEEYFDDHTIEFDPSTEAEVWNVTNE